VSREKIREYAAATGIADEVYRADPATIPAEEIIAPPTFAACFAIGAGELFADPDLGVHFNLVHGSQEFEYQRPVRAGDLLACTPRIVDIVDRDRMELLTFEVECADARTAEPVLTARSTIIFFKPQEG
jgi:hypothetical protein